MNPSTSSTGNGPVEKFLGIPYNQRWEYLKPVIMRMYLEENNKLKRVSERMKDEYSFNAQIGQYQSHFRKWDVRKRTITGEKDAVITALGKRLRQDGISTSNAIINQGDSAKSVDKKQLKRYINQSIREDEPATLHPGIFARYNLPYAALIHSLKGQGSFSPSGASPYTPEYLTINSPQGTVSASSPQDALSPTMQLVKRKTLLNRARLFLEGREGDLMAQLATDELKCVATWLHDFWIYSFMTVKYWGRGPETWDLSLIKFKSFAGMVPPSPIDLFIDQESGPSSRPHLIPDGPTQLCRWSIHYKEPDYEGLPSPPAELHRSEDRFDIDDESTWTEWPLNGTNRDLTNTLARGLQENQFSSIETNELPFATDSVMNAAEKSTDELKAETFGFAIMSRNMNVIENSILDYSTKDLDILSATFPFHLAARFLDGAKTCCLIFEQLVNNLQGSCSIGLKYIDSSGFTVLDTLFVTILRSHSKTSFDILLGGEFADQSQHAGQEVDPCGRWDADSPCIRQLYASGSPKIPHEWKHVFCHTSVQAICHSISAIFSVDWSPDINTSSGLFKRRCSCCGLELKFGPLHALVLTAFYLANDGMPGENLFGMICCLVCLLTHHADPYAAVEISIPELLGRGSMDICQHVTMNPAELAQEIHSERMASWTHEVNRGWGIFLYILRLDREKKDYNDYDDYDDEDYDNEDSDGCFHIFGPTYSNNRQLGQIWAAIQAELLTYRRLSEDDSWLSVNFDMEKLWRALEDNDEELLREFADNPDDKTGESKLEKYSSCGHFHYALHPLCAMREEVCNSYYANLDNWERTTFIRTWDLR
ncbi:hypothetical protein F5Y00DRAFT_270010 [Daldinia vernicosa]|uniref:uncharacterized protein n=1 Tax=Daldinia vernicosa TaxID=114800 RepID=UPI002007E048|nr:uncharacterized protein F5Y00DRAFT_270010 [Daldinia vernicosa]KAI0848813.1 hypothetical protein F5Y00DRAFT_270010 [Daldinia vernicosa]